MNNSRSDADLAEIARSASEARKTATLEVDVARYQNPSAETPFPLEYAFYLLGDVRGKTVLDLGCGSGEEVIPLVKRGAHVIGIDISPELIAIAAQRARHYGVGADLQVGSAYETGLPDHSIDIVFCMSLLHHLDIARANAEIRRVLRADGLLIVKEPIRLSWAAKQLRKLFPAHEDISEFEYPLNATQLVMLTDGFQVLSSRSFRTPVIPLGKLIAKSPQARRRLWSWDAWMLRQIPVLNHFATSRVMALGGMSKA